MQKRKEILSKTPELEMMEGSTDKREREAKIPEDISGTAPSSGTEIFQNDGPAVSLRYTVDDNPPILLCVFLGFQHYLIMFGSTLIIPLVLTPAMCMKDDDVDKSKIVSTIFFVSGLSTVLQSTFGTRLPIIQGGTFSFLVPAFAILALPKFQCPVQISGDVINQTTEMSSQNKSDDDDQLWQIRMREIQGAILVSSLFQVLIGMTGMMGLVLRFIGPLCIAPTLTLIGLSLFEAASGSCSKQWGIAVMTMALLTIFSQYMRNTKLKIPILDGKRCTIKRQPIFQVFPVIISVGIMWLFSYILTISDVFSSDPSNSNYHARTDTRMNILMNAPWARVPYPCQWGMPTVSVAGVFGMLAGVLAGILESVGDYYACARISGAPIPPSHAINRGIFIEGLCCILAGLWGGGNGTTSYSQNIGAISITGVGSRRVVQIAGLIMICLALFGKFGALFVTLPDPIVGGIVMVTFGMIVAVGISNLQFVNINSSRNLFIFGFATFAGLAIPEWLKKNPDVINTGNEIFDQILFVLGRTNMFIGGVLGFFLDNTIPGTEEERGLKQWKSQQVGGSQQQSANNCYDLPLLMNCIRGSKICNYIPISPTYREGCSCSNALFFFDALEQELPSSHQVRL